MTDAIAHRGPDAAGYFLENAHAIGLGHRRLSVLDVSAAANQPFYSACGRYVMVYNGEVYNFKELKNKFQLQTVTNSDTEVIIELFAKMGVDVLPELNGMFALAIWDKAAKQLLLCRDRIGIKPLYYYNGSSGFAFASEIKALNTLPLSKSINYNAVYSFLYSGYIHGTATIYNEYNKLMPGQYAVYKDGQIHIKNYWQPEKAIAPQTITDEAQAKNALNELLVSAVSNCLISDVPLGVFLSGGTDSSIVAAIAQRLTSHPVKTFSIAFSESKFNEAPFAKAVANHIGSNHYEYLVNEKDAIALANDITRVYDEPYGDSSAIPTMLVSQLARQEVTVALSGDGGDELFMGYGFYTWANRLQNPLVAALRQPAAALLQLTGKSRYQRVAALLNYPDAQRKKSHIFSQEQYYFSETEIQQLLIPPAQLVLNEDTGMLSRKLSIAEQQSFFDIKNYLPEELLVKTDRASMRYALEVRVPLLDHRLVEFSLNLSESLKIKNGTHKYLLKQVLYDYVPQHLFNRPKWGFAVPLAKWLKTDLDYLVKDYLDEQVVRECKLVHYNYVQTLVQRFHNGTDYLYTRIWALIILHKWFKENCSE